MCMKGFGKERIKMTILFLKSLKPSKKGVVVPWLAMMVKPRAALNHWLGASVHTLHLRWSESTAINPEGSGHSAKKMASTKYWDLLISYLFLKQIEHINKESEIDYMRFVVLSEHSRWQCYTFPLRSDRCVIQRGGRGLTAGGKMTWGNWRNNDGGGAALS